MHTSTDATNPDEEVIRILAPANPANPDADAWHIVTLTRPRGSTGPVWKPFAAYGPMTLDKANQFLTALGVEAVSVWTGPTSRFSTTFRACSGAMPSTALPELRYRTRKALMPAHYPAGVTLGTEEGIALPRTVALIEQLTSEYGSEYTLLLSRAVEAANHVDQASYMVGLNAAIDVLAGPGGDRPTRKALALSHVGVFLTEIRADIRRASHRGAMPPSRCRRMAAAGRFDRDRRC